jgi:hypothetical protein
MLREKVARKMEAENTTMDSYRFLLGTSEAWRRGIQGWMPRHGGAQEIEEWSAH